MKFLDTITADDAELKAYMQRVIGYCLTGSIQEHALFFGYGTGANGKGVLLNTITGIMGDYADGGTDGDVHGHRRTTGTPPISPCFAAPAW